MHKKIILTVLTLALLLGLCGCAKPQLYTSDRLEVEVKGIGTKTLTLTCTGPDTELYPYEITGGEDDHPIYAYTVKEARDGAVVVKVTGVNEGTCDIVIVYRDDSESYAIASASVVVDEKMKLTVADAFLVGDERFESLGEELPEGSQITKEEGNGKLIRLTEADTPWALEEYDEEILGVQDYGYSEEEQVYEFMVTGRGEGEGTVCLTNRSSAQRITLSFLVESVVDGESSSLNLTLLNSAVSDYNENADEKSIEHTEKMIAEIDGFASEVYIPEGAELMEGGEMEEGGLDISLKIGDNELEYVIHTDVALADELELYETELPDAQQESFQAAGVTVTLFQNEDYAIAMWEEDGLLHELFMMDVADLAKAKELAGSFLAGAQ